MVYPLILIAAALIAAVMLGRRADALAQMPAAAPVYAPPAVTPDAFRKALSRRAFPAHWLALASIAGLAAYCADAPWWLHIAALVAAFLAADAVDSHAVHASQADYLAPPLATEAAPCAALYTGGPAYGARLVWAAPIETPSPRTFVGGVIIPQAAALTAFAVQRSVKAGKETVQVPRVEITPYGPGSGPYLLDFRPGNMEQAEAVAALLRR